MVVLVVGEVVVNIDDDHGLQNGTEPTRDQDRASGNEVLAVNGTRNNSAAEFNSPN